MIFFLKLGSFLLLYFPSYINLIWHFEKLYLFLSVKEMIFSLVLNYSRYQKSCFHPF